MQPLAIWLTCVCRPTLCMVASNYVPRHLGLCWSRVPGLLPVSAASPSMDHEHGTVCQPILEHQIRPSAPSSVISRPTCFSSSQRCCLQVGSAPFVRRRCDCLASSVLFTNIQTYLLTYLPTIKHPVSFTGRMPFLSPNQQCQSTEGKISHSMDLLTPSFIVQYSIVSIRVHLCVCVNL